MPEPGNEDVVVRLRAQVDQLQRDLDKANEQIKSFGEKAKQGFSELGKEIAKAFAAEKVLEFIKSGIEGFAEYERALDSLGKKITSAGGNWSELRESVEAYARGIKETTRFSDDEAVKALDTLMLKTNDYSTALKLNERAMNLSVLANIPLSEAAQTLGLAYEGNTRGLMMLGRQLGMSAKESKDAQDVFDELDKRSQGLARTEDNLATNLEKARHQFEDAAKAIGDALAPAVSFLARWFADIIPRAITYTIKVVQTFGAAWGSIILGVMNYADLWRDRITALATFLLTVWRHPIDAWQKMHRDMESANKNFAANERARATAEEEVAVKIWEDTAGNKHAIDVKALNDRLVVANAEKNRLHDLGKSELDYWHGQEQRRVTMFGAFSRSLTDVHRVYVQKKGEEDAAYRERVKEDQRQIEETVKATYSQIQQAAGEMASTLAAVGGEWVKQWQDHTFTVLGAFKALAQGIVRYLLKAIGKALTEEGASYFAKGMAALLGVVTAAAAPGFFAAAAELSAAGGVIMGVADSVKLASGGIVTKPTRALIGEAGPEAVIPLGNSGIGGAMGDTTFKDTKLVFPGVRDVRDLQGSRFQQTAERVLADTWQRMNQRKGIKVPA